MERLIPAFYWPVVRQTLPLIDSNDEQLEKIGLPGWTRSGESYNGVELFFSSSSSLLFLIEFFHFITITFSEPLQNFSDIDTVRCVGDVGKKVGWRSWIEQRNFVLSSSSKESEVSESSFLITPFFTFFAESHTLYGTRSIAIVRWLTHYTHWHTHTHTIGRTFFHRAIGKYKRKCWNKIWPSTYRHNNGYLTCNHGKRGQNFILGIVL